VNVIFLVAILPYYHTEDYSVQWAFRGAAGVRNKGKLKEDSHMISRWFVCAGIALWIGCPVMLSAQTNEPTGSIYAPPALLVLVHQEFQFGKETARQQLEAAISRACEHLKVPNSWIDLQSITGQPEALSFDPFDSFEQVDEAFAAWPRIYGSHPELARMQQEIRTLETSDRTIIAIRRSDLSYRASSIDLSKMRFMRVLEVLVRPGHEADFAEAFKTLREAYLKINAGTPWVVYQVNAGMPSPAFLAFVPMGELKQNDDLLGLRSLLQEAEGEVAADRMQEIARESYVSTESDLYAVSAATSRADEGAGPLHHHVQGVRLSSGNSVQGRRNQCASCDAGPK
jgi:hypothetical protein